MFEYVEKRFVWVTVVGERGERRVCVAGNATGPLRQERNLFFFLRFARISRNFFYPLIENIFSSTFEKAIEIIEQPNDRVYYINRFCLFLFSAIF